MGGEEFQEVFQESWLKNPAVTYRELLSRKEANISPEESVALAATQFLLNLESDLIANLQSINAQQLQSPRDKGLYQYLLATTYLKGGRFDDAIDLLQSELLLPYVQKNAFFKVLLLQELAYAFGITEQFSTAYDYLYEAFELASQVESQFGVALVQITSGNVYYFNGDYDQARDYYQRALVHFKQLNYPYYLGDIYLGLAGVDSKLGQYSEALEYYDAYDQVANYVEDIGDRFHLFYGRATLYSHTGRCKESLQDIEKALQLDGPKDYISELQKTKAKCAIQVGDTETAILANEKARQAISKQTELAGTLWEADITLIDAKIAVATGNLTTAIANYEAYIEQYRLASQLKYSQDLAKQKLNYENFQKDLRIQLLEEKTKLRNYLVIGVIIIALLILLGFFWQKRQSKIFYERSIIDPLTGLYNRRFALQTLEFWKEKTLSADYGWCLAVIDIDNFKSVNDTYGHNVGDAMIKHLAEMAKMSARSNDVVARFGGEEFVIALARTDKHEAAGVLERFRASMANSHVLAGDNNVSRTVSIGAVMVTHSDWTMEEWLEKADAALYTAKRGGKNRIEFAVV